MSEQQAAGEDPQEKYEGYVQAQADRQWNGRASTLKRALDFGPFLDGLAGSSVERAAELDRLAGGASVTELGRRMTLGALTAEDLVLGAVLRIRRLDAGKLNSVLELNPDALAVARALDAERLAGASRGPLHGIPVLLKDNVATGDRMRTTAGAAALAEARSDRDSFIARRLREAGAVILGKANLSEWANYMTSRSTNGYSALGGFTRNPRGRFDVGGSSSGSAAAVAAGLAPLAVGTETCGSITSPSSQNGVVGLKPTLGLVSRDGIVPISDELDTAGPIARTVEDAILLMAVMAGEDPRDPATARASSVAANGWSGLLDEDALRGKRVGRITDIPYGRPGDDEQFHEAARLLRAAGAQVEDVAVRPPGDDLAPLMDYGIRAGVDAYLNAQPEGTAVRSLREVVAFNAEAPDVRAPAGQDLLERALASPLTETEYRRKAGELRAAAAGAIEAALRERGLHLLLSLNNHAAGLYAPAGFPALTVPGLRRPTGEPVGITLIAAGARDPELLAAGYALERAMRRA